MRAYLLREQNRIRVVAPFVEDFKDDLKSGIPYYSRTFDGEGKNWLVDNDYEDDLLEIAGRYFDPLFLVTEGEALRREQAARRAANSAAPAEPHSSEECARRVRHIWQDEATLHLLPGAPRAVIDAAYRAVARLLHPDVSKTDTHADMVRVNLAYEKLKQRYPEGSR